MNPTIQSGTHPDAESLTAFAEQSLSGAEREQILAHMSVCGRCREVVFLAHQAAESEQPSEVLQQRSGRQQSRPPVARRWFGGWRWAWIPVAALAGFIGIAVVQHGRRAAAPPQQVAQYAPETRSLRNATAAKSAESPAPAQLQASRQPAANETRNELTAAREKENQLADRDGRVVDEKKSEESKQKDMGGIGGSLGVVSSKGISGGASRGMVAARATSPSMGGPAALNQFQQQNMNQLQQQNNASQAQQASNAQQTQEVNDALRLDAVREADKPAYLANKPAPPPLPTSITETVNVQAEPVVPVTSAAAAPAPQIAPVPVAGQSFGLATETLAKRKTAKLALPGGAQPLSVASAGRLSIAIDTAGALFLSRDGSKHWQPIKTQWPGRAVLVRAKQSSLHGTLLSLNGQPQFELVNDKLETWSSPDGMTWTLETPTAK
jgi:hypothetical protein